MTAHSLRTSSSLALSVVVLLLFLPLARATDLRHARVLSPVGLASPERKAVQMLIEEVEKRSQVRWPTSNAWSTFAGPTIVVCPASRWLEIAPPGFESLEKNPVDGRPEGFRILSGTHGRSPFILILGNDERGMLFGVGKFLRSVHLAAGQLSIDDGFNIASAPRYPLRGHQLGYRPKTHSYDAWDVPTWEQYIRDLAVFGCNAVELLPPRTDDDATSPLFPLPPLPMLQNMSRILDEYGLDVWMWYPAMDPDYGNPKTIEAAVEEWAAIFKATPRLDAVFVPGGDPGHTRPLDLLTLLERQTTNLHRFHPKAQMWVSPQGFTAQWLEEFVTLLKEKRPEWLTGIVFGPQVRVDLAELRALIPARYPIRNYPDITHSRQCQFPVPDWDTAFAVTSGREGINPRPVDEAAIFRRQQPHTVGFITYSEGCNDDVNKTIWSALGWDPDADITEILREFGRYFIKDEMADSFAQGLLSLERNWRGPLLVNSGVETTLLQFQDLERISTRYDQENWRFQEALYRAYYDAYTRSRLVYETELEDRAMDALRSAPTAGAVSAIHTAETILERALTQRVSLDRRTRVFELAEALFQSIRFQSSVERYHAIGTERGATLDTLDTPLNNRLWLKSRFAAILKLVTENERLTAIDKIIHWTDPGPGGFYDDLGNLRAQPHLVRGLPFAQDPASFLSSRIGFAEAKSSSESADGTFEAWRHSWVDHAESLHDAPLRLHYGGLDPTARYTLRVVYAGDAPSRKIRLQTGTGVEIHPFLTKPSPVGPTEFQIPPAATAGGLLDLEWSREAGMGGNGRGCQVSEVWLIRQR